MGVDAIMYVVVPNTEDVSEIKLKKLSGDLCERFGSSKFFIDLEGKYTETPRHAISIEEDEDKIAKDNEILLCINIFSRYYGPGYERGDWVFLKSLGEMLEYLFPKGRVLYGSDSTNEIILFDESYREEINQHFLKNGHEPYNSAFGRLEPGIICNFCGGRPAMNHGGGGNQSFWQCHGCGTKAVRTPKGIYSLSEDEKDFFGFEEKPIPNPGYFVQEVLVHY